ncbi:uroporphyrinogen-III synthase [bacterium]|nr:uroporphyrinogen-III synthase [bacterium]MBU1989447.1 uroporphyrinogen-III synthase [bacterium]
MPKQIYLFSISSHPQAISINSLDIKFLKPKIDFSQYDYLIITSKQASEALKQYDSEEYFHMPALCVSSASAAAYEEIGGKILDIGGGYGDNLAQKIFSYGRSKRWLYLRAEIVASDFISTCQEQGCQIEEIVVYKSECSKEIRHVEVAEDSVLIFTSPSSVKCFLKEHTISPHAEIIVIGTTTAEALPKGIRYTISEITTIENCMETALSL